MRRTSSRKICGVRQKVGQRDDHVHFHRRERRIMEFAKFKERFRGSEKCCRECFMSLVCASGITGITKVFRCRHCSELNIVIVDTPLEGIGKRARSFKIPEVCPQALRAIYVGNTYCDACKEAIEKDECPDAAKIKWPQR